MAIRQPFYTEEITLAAGASTSILSVQGQRIIVIECDHEELRVKLDQHDFIPCGPGLPLNVGADEFFSSVQFKNHNGTSATFRAVIGWIEYNDTRTHIPDGEALPVEIANSPGDALEDATDLSITATGSVTILADVLQDEIMIQNLSLTHTLRVGPNAGASRGLKLPPEGLMTLETKAAFDIYNTGASVATVAVLRLKRS